MVSKQTQQLGFKYSFEQISNNYLVRKQASRENSKQLNESNLSKLSQKHKITITINTLSMHKILVRSIDVPLEIIYSQLSQGTPYTTGFIDDTQNKH